MTKKKDPTICGGCRRSYKSKPCGPSHAVIRKAMKKAGMLK